MSSKDTRQLITCLENRKNKLQNQMELTEQVEEIIQIINAIVWRPTKQGSNAENYSPQDFVHKVRPLVQDNQGQGQRKPGAEAPELITELQVRSNKVKRIIASLDQKYRKTALSHN